YGILGSTLSGFGNYQDVTDFVNKIENSQLLNKIRELAIAPAGNDEELDEVNFSFELDSYYSKGVNANVDSLINEFNIVLNEDVSTYNPLYPLIQPSLAPNTEGYSDIRSSRLIGLTESRVFIRNQSGRLVTLREGDPVYLGSLTSINLQNNSATFTLNLGGILEVITLEVVR
ncbi:MAG: hypothetical protein MI700_04345, partial [Balneolales bacterium]|nr:hypothetical protein [Balneolales bacterium]